MSLSNKIRGAICVFACVLSCVASSTAEGADRDASPMHIVIDARDLPRKLLNATITMPIEATSQLRPLTVWYPKWVPGSHGPGGPVANIAGLKITDNQGRSIDWSRSPGEIYRIELDVPADANALTFQVRYIANQPTTNSFGHDVFGANHLGVISPGTVLFYQEGDSIDETKITTELLLPFGWQAATALKPSGTEPEQSKYSFEPSTLRTFVDSPIMCGQFHNAYSLAEVTEGSILVPHHLHVFGDSQEMTELNPELVGRLTEMVSQTAKLTGSQPFDEFTFLLGVTDQLPANGLEHSRSTLNVLPPGSVRSLAALKGWSRLLIPHEFLHSWCGKYRRPDAMVTEDFHQAKGTDLLWVYEGLTQYLGELVEARCGLMSPDEFRHRLSVELRNATHQQNRQWRPLDDTAAASHVLRDGSASWPRLRGGQDYYMEGMLFWLEVDALLRKESKGKKTLDDFCQAFFRVDKQVATALSSPPKPFSRDEIVLTLNRLMKYDWEGLIRRRVESARQNFDPSVAELLGYRFEPLSRPAGIPASTFRYPSGVDFYDSLGVVFGNRGGIRDQLLDSPADRAKLGPGMKVLGINGRTWDDSRMREAVKNSATNSQPIELVVSDGDLLKNIQIQYYEGAKYLALTRDEDSEDLLEAILMKR